MEPGHEPLVSILTPSYEHGAWLADNLASVANQTYPRIEHVVIDGNSQDGSIEILKNAASNVDWESEPDEGQADALQKALERSNGDIIGWLNSDDAYFSRTAVASAVAVFDQRPDVDVVYGHCAVVNGNGDLLHFRWVPPFSYRLLLLDNFIYQPSVFLRRSALEGRIVEGSFEHVIDRELWLRLGARHRFHRIDQVLAIDRNHPARKSTALSDEVWEERHALDARYGAPTGRWVFPARFALAVMFRWMGGRLAARSRGPYAFDVQWDSRPALIVRQIARRRTKMLR